MLKLTKKVTAVKEGLHCQGLWLKEHQKLNLEDFSSCLLILKHMDKQEVAQDAQRLHRVEKRQSHTMMDAEKESERSLRDP